MPDLMTADPDGWGFLRHLNTAMQSPLFQSGAAMVAAGAQGLNPGSGFLAGTEAAGKASQSALAAAKQRRELEQMQIKDQMWRNLTGGQTPPWAQGLPAGTVDLARALGPDAGASLLTNMLSKNAEGTIERDKLKETSRYHDILAKQTEAQLMEARQMNAERILLMDANRRQAEQTLLDAQEKAARRREMFAPPPEAPQAAPPPPPVRAIPQSNEVEPQDPNLIRTQAVTQPAAPVQQPQSPGVPANMVPTPRGPMPPDQARAFGQKLLADPEYSKLGRDIIKQADELAERGSLGQTAKNKVEESLVGDVNHLARLNDIENSVKSEYLKLGPRVVSSLQGVAEFAGVPLKPEDQQKLADFTAFRRKVVSNFNLLLKEASGTAVTESELRRMVLQEPNAEWNGMFSPPDSPTQFMAKLQSSKADLMKAIARKNFMRNAMNLSDGEIAGLLQQGSVIPLDNMKKIMDEQQRGIERRLKIQYPDAKPEEIQPLIRNQMKQVFGI